VRQPRLDDRRVQLAAEHEDRGNEIQKHQRDDDRGQTRIHGHVVVGEPRQILSEYDARHQRGQEGEDDAGQDLQEAAASRRQPGMQDEQRDGQRGDRDAVAGDVEELLVALDHQRNMAAHRLDDQWAQHDQERHGERGEGGDQRVSDRFQPQPVPAARFDHGIGAVERDAQRFDAVRGKIDRKHRADGQNAGPRRHQHVVHFAGKRVGNLRGPGLQQQRRGLVGEFLRAEKARQGGQHDQERKHRHQGRQRDMAGDRPAIIGEEGVERVQADVKDVAKLPHMSPCASGCMLNETTI